MTTPVPRPLDLSPIHPSRTPSPGVPQAEAPRPRTEASGPHPQDGRGESEVERLRAALEDVVALAGASGDATARVVQVRRRALAALAGMDARP